MDIVMACIASRFSGMASAAARSQNAATTWPLRAHRNSFLTLALVVKSVAVRTAATPIAAAISGTGSCELRRRVCAARRRTFCARSWRVPAGGALDEGCFQMDSCTPTQEFAAPSHAEAPVPAANDFETVDWEYRGLPQFRPSSCLPVSQNTTRRWISGNDATRILRRSSRSGSLLRSLGHIRHLVKLRFNLIALTPHQMMHRCVAARLSQAFKCGGRNRGCPGFRTLEQNVLHDFLGDMNVAQEVNAIRYSIGLMRVNDGLEFLPPISPCRIITASHQ